MYLKTTITADLGVPGSQAWQVLNDFGGHYQFNPLIQLSPIVNGITHGLGAEREISLYDGSTMRQKILDFEEGESILIGFTETDLPIKNATAKFTIEPPNQKFCRISIDIVYEPKFGVLGGVVGMFLRPSIRQRYHLVLRGLKYFVTTGQTVAGVVP